MPEPVPQPDSSWMLAPVRARLAALARQERLHRAMLGAGKWVATLALTLLAMMLADNQLDRLAPLDGTPVWLRLIMRFILMALGVYLAWRWMIKPACMAKLDENTLAESVEKTNPAFNHSLVTALAYARGTAMPAHDALVRAITEQSAQLALQGDWSTALKKGRPARGSLLALLGIAPFLVLLAWNAPWLLALLARQAGFNKPIPRGIVLTLTAQANPLNLPVGEEGNLELSVLPQGQTPNTCTLVLRQKDGLQRSINAPAGVVTIPADWGPGTLLAQTGPIRSSNEVELLRLERPILEINQSLVHLPAWVGKQANGQPWPGSSRGGDMAGWEGSTIKLSLRSSQPIRQVTVEKITTQGTSLPVAVTLAADGRTLEAQTEILATDRLWQATAISIDGLATRFPLRRRLEAWPAIPPEVEILPELMLPATPEKLFAGIERAKGLRQALEEHEVDGIPVPPGGKFRIAYKASSRAGIARARLLFRVVSGPWKSLPLPETTATGQNGEFITDLGVFLRTPENQEIPFHAVTDSGLSLTPGRELAGGRFDFRIGPLENIKPGDRIEYIVEVDDHRSPPLQGRSSTRVKEVVTLDDYLGWLARREREQERMRELRIRQAEVFEGLLPGSMPVQK
jgi:hypothetical protein